MNAGLVQGLYGRFEAALSDEFVGGWHFGRAEFDGHPVYPYLVAQDVVSLTPDYTTGSHEHGQAITETVSLAFMVFSPNDTGAARLSRLVESEFVRGVMRNPIQWGGDERGRTMRASLVSGTQYEDPDKESDGTETGRTIWTAVKVIEFLIERST